MPSRRAGVEYHVPDVATLQDLLQTKSGGVLASSQLSENLQQINLTENMETQSNVTTTSGASNDTIAAVAAVFSKIAPQVPHLLQEPPAKWVTKERLDLLKMIHERYKQDATLAWMYQWYLLTWQTEVSNTGRFLSEEACTDNLLRYLAQTTSQPTSTSQVIIQPHVTETNIELAIGRK